jgi:hypothetical protein
MVDSPLSDWLAQHTGRAPRILGERVRRHVSEVGASGPAATVLAEASRRALNRVVQEPDGGRAIALDLLAADALITLALLAQAQSAPADLESFASDLLHEPVGPG